MSGVSVGTLRTMRYRLVEPFNIEKMSNNCFNLTSQVKQMLDGFFSSIPAYGDYTDTN